MNRAYRISVLVLLILAFTLSMLSSCGAAENKRPFIWVKSSDRPDILQKIERNPWANELFQTLKSRADEATSDNLAERREKLMALPLIWPEDGNTTPTLRTYGNDDKHKYEEKRKWGHPRALQEAMVKGLQDGVDCGVLYYLTEESRYAECAADILATFVNALAIMKVPEGDFNAGWIYEANHLLEARVVGAQIPIIFDFVNPWLKDGGKAYDLATGELQRFDFDAAQDVFRTYAALALNRGLLDSNWPILESSSLVHNILALDDEKERASMLPFYLDKDTDHQASLKMVSEMYENPGDIWPESLGYSRHVTAFSIYLMTALDRIYPDLGLGERYPNIAESMTAFYNLQFPNDSYPFFGDGHRHYEVEYDFYEMALQLAVINGNDSQTKTFSDFLLSSIVNGKYDRGALEQRGYGASPYFTPLKLLWSLDDLDGDESVDVEPPRPRTNRVPHAGMTIQRIISEQHPVKDSLMAFTAGGSYIHGHASGMDMELYGQGYVLGIDGGKGQYGSDMHENYYRLFAAHNSVISNGASGSSGGWINMGINQVQPVALEPAAGAIAASPKHSFATNSFYDEYNLIAPAEHQRTIALIKLSDSRGYYLDVFRARSDTEGQFHDYLYHNIGDTLDITTEGEALPMTEDEDRYQASDQIAWSFHDVYQHPGWHFFEDVRSSTSSDESFAATFTTDKLGDAAIVMRALIPAGLASEVSKMRAPKAYGAAKPYNDKPLPTFALRHEGEAWSNPFAVIYESYTDKPALISVERLMENGEFKGVTVVSNVDNHVLTQYVLVQESMDDEYVNDDLGITFKGQFAVLTLDQGGKLQDAYIGSGHHLNYNGFTVSADESTRAAYLEK